MTAQNGTLKKVSASSSLPARGGAAEPEDDQQLFDQFKPLLYGAMKRLGQHPPYDGANAREDVKDALQSGREALLKASRAYDVSRGTTLGAAARKPVYGAIRKELQAQHAWRKRTEPIDKYGSETNAPCDASALTIIDADLARADEADSVVAVGVFVAALPPADRNLVSQIFAEGHSQAEVARQRGVSRAAIHQQLDRILRRGRHELAEFDPTHAA